MASSTAIVLFTRDLRVHDHPALAAAAETADHVIPLFVLDDAILDTNPSPNRLGFLAESLADLDAALRDRGGRLVVRRGDPVEQAAILVERFDVAAVHLSDDVSGHAARRSDRLAKALAPLRCELVLHPGVTVVPPGELTPTSGGDHFKVFTPYWKQWKETRLRPLAATPERIALPEGLAPLPDRVTAHEPATPTPAALSKDLEVGALPTVEDLVGGRPRSPEVATGGEVAGRRKLDRWLAGPVDAYGDGRDDLAGDGTSGLSPYLHFGCVSPREILDRLDRRNPGQDAFARQLCWRDFHHQVTASHRMIAREEYRPRGDDWLADDDAFTAWTDGRTGYPIVDAGMRQLRREGWMHNRTRMIVASFLTKDLYVDWRLGADHFLDWLVDGDIANNYANWQWVAGTGTDTRPNRVYNPVTQAARFDPDGAYIRRYVPELAEVEPAALHDPSLLADTLFTGRGPAVDYPRPIVDHAAARERFLARRGAA